MMSVLLALGLLATLLVLRPILAPARVTPQDTRRTELEEERELLLGNLGELQAQGADASALTREKVRLTQVLHELDALPPTPKAGQARPALPVAAATLLGTALLLGIGTVTFFPQWRNLGLSPAEQTQLESASRLPALANRARSSGQAADYLAWGDAAWDARQYRQSAEAYTQVLLAERDHPKAMRRVGYVLLGDAKMAENGLSFIARAAQLDPQAPEGQLLYGYALGTFGQYPQALEVLANYRRLAPDSGEADDLIVEYQAKVGGTVDGQLVYAQNCAGCHGRQGEGGTGPKLVGSPALRNETALRQIVLQGATGMPAFPQLEGKQLDALVQTLKGKEWQ